MSEVSAPRSFGFLARKQATGAGHIDPHVTDVLKSVGVSSQPAAGTGDYFDRAADYHNIHTTAGNAANVQQGLEYLQRKKLIEGHWTPAI